MTRAFPTSQIEEPEVHIERVFDHLVACGKIGIAPGNLYFPLGVAIHPASNNIYITEGSLNHENSTRVSIFSDYGEYLNSYTNEHMEALWGIAIHENNVYVTDWKVHTVFYLKIESDLRLIAILGSKGSDFGQFNEPRQLSISTNGDVYIADSYNDRIQVLDSSHHPIKELTHPSIHSPIDVKLTIEEIYVLCSGDSTHLHVFNYSGHKIRDILTRGDEMQAASCFFCLGPENCLIMSDIINHNIKIFSNNGELLHTLGECGHEAGMFYSPFGLTLTTNLKLVTVSMSLKYGLQIFSFL